MTFTPGLRPWIPEQLLHIGDTSRGLRILGSGLQGRTYWADVEGRPHACSSLTIFTPWHVKQTRGGNVASRQKAQWDFVLSPEVDLCTSAGAATSPRDNDSYRTWKFEVDFAP